MWRVDDVQHARRAIRGTLIALAIACAGCALPRTSARAFSRSPEPALQAVAVDESLPRDYGVDNGGDFPNGASIVPPGRVQVEIDSVLETTSGPSTAGYSLPTLFRIGLVERAELRLGASAFNYNQTPDNDSSGFGPVSIGTKYRFYDGGGESFSRPTAFALQVGFLVPAGSSDFVHSSSRTSTVKNLQPSASMNFDYDFPGRWEAAVNLGLGAPVDDNDDAFLQGFLQWSLTYDVLDRLQLYADGSVSYPDDRGEYGNVNLIGGGWMWYFGRSYALFGAYNVGTNRDSPDVNANFGLAFSF